MDLIKNKSQTLIFLVLSGVALFFIHVFISDPKYTNIYFLAFGKVADTFVGAIFASIVISYLIQKRDDKNS